MACCAFAVFVLTQLLAPFVWLRRRLFGAPLPAANTAVAWTLEAVATRVPAPRRRWTHKTFFTAVALELLMGAAALAYVAPRADTSAWIDAQAWDGAWCGALVGRIGAGD